MQIVSVKARNVKGCSFVEIKPKQTTTVIGGKNGNGKSSFLDAIAYTLGGQKLCPSQPIKKGQDEAECEVELTGDNGRLLPPCTVKRRWYRSKDSVKSELEIVTKDGFRAPTPQTILDDVTGKLGFDPERFLRMSPKEQVAILQELVKLDFTELDAEHKRVYEERTGINKQGIQAKALFEKAPHHPDAPESEVSVAELMAQLKKLTEGNNRNAAARRQLTQQERGLATLDENVDRVEKTITQLEEQLERARLELAAAQKAQSDGKAAIEAKKAEIAGLKDADTTEVENKITESETVNRKVRENAKRAELEQQVKELRAQSQAKTDRLDAINAEKSKLTTEAKWPVEGLGFSEDGVTFNGLPFEQASSREQREVAVAIGCELSPSLQFMFIKDGSLLDHDALAHVAEIAARRGYQLFIERVGEGEECNVVISNGEVSRIDDELRPDDSVSKRESAELVEK